VSFPPPAHALTWWCDGSPYGAGTRNLRRRGAQRQEPSVWGSAFPLGAPLLRRCELRALRQDHRLLLRNEVARAAPLLRELRRECGADPSTAGRQLRGHKRHLLALRREGQGKRRAHPGRDLRRRAARRGRPDPRSFVEQPSPAVRSPAAELWFNCNRTDSITVLRSGSAARRRATRSICAFACRQPWTPAGRSWRATAGCSPGRSSGASSSAIVSTDGCLRFL
jgi:hypothetical protein